jgi:thiamin-phosphate kinase
MASEFELIRRFFDRPVQGGARTLLGVGDDAALLRVDPGMALVVSTDMLLVDRHFSRDAPPRALGHKALAVNLSDLAAMGATPRWATLSIALPAADEAWLTEFAEGLFALARRFEVDLVGGDTTRGPLAISVTVLGEVPEAYALLRGGARPGDDIWVSGMLGAAGAALAASQNRARLEPQTALRWASVCAAWQALRSTSRTALRRISGTCSSAPKSARWCTTSRCRDCAPVTLSSTRAARLLEATTTSSYSPPGRRRAGRSKHSRASSRCR